jgi:hypothetical protein
MFWGKQSIEHASRDKGSQYIDIIVYYILFAQNFEERHCRNVAQNATHEVLIK